MPPNSSLPPLRDCIRPGLRVLFVGINPGIRSSLTGHHFAGPSNRFWKLLHDSRLVPERLTHLDDRRLPEWGFGITNIVARPTPGSGDLDRDELLAGGRRLRRKVQRWRPGVVALVGVTVFRAVCPDRRGPVALGLQAERISRAPVFVLPNPSGRNANVTSAGMQAAFAALASYLVANGPSQPPRRARDRHRGASRGSSAEAANIVPAADVERGRIRQTRDAASPPCRRVNQGEPACDV